MPFSSVQPTPIPGFSYDQPTGAPPKPTPSPASHFAPSPPAPAAKTEKPWWEQAEGAVGGFFKGARKVIGTGVADVRNSVRFAQLHPSEAVSDVTTSLQRGVGEVLANAQDDLHRARASQHLSDDGGLAHVAGTVGALLEHPESVVPSFARGLTDSSVVEQRRTTESVRQFVSAPTHAAIDQWVKAHVPKELQPYASAIAKGGEDFGIQAVSDPLTYADGIGLAARFLGRAAKGSKMAQYLYKAAEAAGASKYFQHLKDTNALYRTAANVATRVATGLHKLFVARPELDATFTKSGKNARISLENAVISRVGRLFKGSEAAVQKGGQDLMDHFLGLYHEFGGNAQRAQAQALGHVPGNARSFAMDILHGKVSNELASFMRLPKDLQTAKLSDMEQAVRKGLPDVVNVLTKKLAQSHPDILKPGATLDGLDKLLVNDPRYDKMKKVLDSMGVGGLARLSRSLGRQGIALNPLPHEVKNVGTLAYYAGGIHMIPQMFKTALSGGVPQAVRHELEQIGAAPTMFQHAEDSIFTKIPGVGPQYKKMVGTLFDKMQELDTAYRASLLKQYSKTMPYKTAADKLLVGRKIAEKIGDPRTQNAIVKLFEAFGGQFVAYRLGISPKAVLMGLAEHPTRIAQPDRAITDIQHDRSAQGQNANELTFRTPAAEAMELGASLLGPPLGEANPFFASPATSGVAGQSLAAQHSKQSTFQRAAETAGYYLPGGSLVENTVAAAHGDFMPGQKMTLTDRLVWSVLAPFGVYFRRQEKPSTVRSENKQTLKSELK